MQVLSGSRLAARIKEVCHGEGARKLAVAFWGPDLPAALFPDGFADVEIILDVAMRGTSKAALQALGVPDAENVRVCDGLHAKLYIGGSGAIIGSANASKNALGGELQGGRLQELGVWIDAVEDQSAYEDAIANFERLMAMSRLATQADIDRAPEQALPNVVWSPPATEPTDFLAIVTADPHRFQDTLFIFADADITEAERAEKEEVEHELDLAEVERDEALEDILVYGASYTHELERIDAHRFIVMFYWSGERRTPTLHAYHSKRPLPLGKLGNYHYQGYDSWERYRDIKGLTSISRDPDAVARQGAMEAARLRGSQPRGERWKEYTAFELAEALVVPEE